MELYMSKVVSLKFNTHLFGDLQTGTEMISCRPILVRQARGQAGGYETLTDLWAI